MSLFEGITVHRTTTAQQVADALSERILAGAFSPGDRLRESAIAAELHVARNTVREAVRILELGGLVRHEINRGAVVISPTPEKVEALYTARLRLESAAVSRPATESQLELLRAALKDLESAVQTRSVSEIVTVDLAFHCAIVSMLESIRISEFYEDLTQELRFYLMVVSHHDGEYEDDSVIVEEHETILRAIESGSTQAATAAVAHHIETNSVRVREILAEFY